MAEEDKAKATIMDLVTIATEIREATAVVRDIALQVLATVQETTDTILAGGIVTVLEEEEEEEEQAVTATLAEVMVAIIETPTGITAHNKEVEEEEAVVEEEEDIIRLINKWNRGVSTQMW